MSADRVDKQWQKAGLGGYSTAAIIGTLAHYGITVDEAGFKTQAAEHYPLELASAWQETWTGTGQFARFPLPAADELWRRVHPDKLAPNDLALAVATLVNELGGLLAGGREAGVEAAFAKAEELRARVPQKDGAPEDAFLDDVFTRMDEGLIRAFDEVCEHLAQASKIDLALRFAALEEALLPQRQGISRALIQAAQGDTAGAESALLAMTKDSKREPPARLLPLDALIHLKAHKPALDRAKAMLDEAEAAKEFHLALALCGRVADLLETLNLRGEMGALEERMGRIAEEHDVAHPHHAEGS